MQLATSPAPVNTCWHILANIAASSMLPIWASITPHPLKIAAVFTTAAILGRASKNLSGLSSIYCGPGRIRTSNTLCIRQMLYRWATGPSTLILPLVYNSLVPNKAETQLRTHAWAARHPKEAWFMYLTYPLTNCRTRTLVLTLTAAPPLWIAASAVQTGNRENLPLVIGLALASIVLNRTQFYIALHNRALADKLEWLGVLRSHPETPPPPYPNLYSLDLDAISLSTIFTSRPNLSLDSSLIATASCGL